MENTLKIKNIITIQKPQDRNKVSLYVYEGDVYKGDEHIATIRLFQPTTMQAQPDYYGEYAITPKSFEKNKDTLIKNGFECYYRLEKHAIACFWINKKHFD